MGMLFSMFLQYLAANTRTHTKKKSKRGGKGRGMRLFFFLPPLPHLVRFLSSSLVIRSIRSLVLIILSKSVAGRGGLVIGWKRDDRDFCGNKSIELHQVMKVHRTDTKMMF